MKKAAVLSFSERGKALAQRIAQVLAAEYDACLVEPRGGLQDATGKLFETCDALVFVGACGIAVRAVAPFVVSKTSDPAVLVVDERFAKEGIRLFVGPTGDDYYRGYELEKGYCSWAEDLPKLYGTVVAEFSAFSGLVPMGMKEFWSEEKQQQYLKERFGDALEGILEAFRTAYPDHPLIDCAYTDTSTRLGTMKTALMASENGRNNTWVFVLSYDFPMEGGAPAFHCGDIPFAFHNIQAVPVANEEVVGERLEAQMFGAFMAFVKNGDPNHAGIPYWKPVNRENEATMYFDVKSECRENADKELLKRIAASSPLSLPHIRMAKED